ncbi:MAG: PIN domain-containing protein [Candidatus Sulfotelmatobacter sp.]
MDRLFLDANVFFSAAYRLNARLLQLWELKDTILCSSHYAVEEAGINLTDEGQRRRLSELSAALHLFEAVARQLPPGVSLPEKDVPIILAAIEARATHLLTGDIRHFGPYFGKKIESIQILLPGEYLRRRVGKTLIADGKSGRRRPVDG